MEPVTTFTSRLAPLPIRDVDTDQIIPARFLKGTVKSGMGAHLFCDWRHDEEGKPRPDFILNQPQASGAQVLLAGHNFGCGSSREHAPWALLDFGFRAVISTSFGDIFSANSLKNGLLPVVVDPVTHAALLTRVTKDPGAQVTIDLASETLTLPDGSAVSFPIDSFSRQCLLDGVDQLGYILKHQDKIAAYERERA